MGTEQIALLEKAVKNAILKIGVAEFRKTSFFASNRMVRELEYDI